MQYCKAFLSLAILSCLLRYVNCPANNNNNKLICGPCDHGIMHQNLTAATTEQLQTNCLLFHFQVYYFIFRCHIFWLGAKEKTLKQLGYTMKEEGSVPPDTFQIYTCVALVNGYKYLLHACICMYNYSPQCGGKSEFKWFLKKLLAKVNFKLLLR